MKRRFVALAGALALALAADAAAAKTFRYAFQGDLNALDPYTLSEIDELNKKILVETDIAKRDAMIAEAYRINHEEAGVIPLHQQALVWGVSNKVDIVQRADNQILFYWAKMK